MSETKKTKGRYEILAEIQEELNVPKDKYNSYGGFSYRSYEDIVEAVKPICKKHRTTLVVTDEIIEVGGWHYVKAVASIVFWDVDLEHPITVTACAREAESKKGSDVSQVTGMASTYARKYALCGLFSIDGQDDADAMNNTPQKPSKRASEPVKFSPKAELWEILQREAGKLGFDPMDGIKAMKGWDVYEDTDEFYSVVVESFKKDALKTLARFYPSIEEVR